MMHRSRRIHWVGGIVIAFGLITASCSSAPAGYGPDAEAAFVAGCAPDHAEPARSLCTCAYRRLRDQLPFEQYRAIDRQLQQGNGTVPDEVKQAVDACNRDTRASQSASSGP